MFTLHIELDGRTLVQTLDLDPALPNEATILSFLNDGVPYEPDVSAVLARVLAPGDTFVDVGANIGYFTTLGGLLVGSAGRVVAFEPDPRNLDRLRMNIGLNDLTQVTVLERAATNQIGEASFFLNDDNSGGNALWDVGRFPGNHLSLARPRVLAVETTTIDAEVARLRLAPPKLIKIDTEGAEHVVLLGAQGLLTGCRTPYVVAELHEFGLGKLGSSAQDLRDYMRGFGYETWALHYDGSLPRQIPPGTRLCTNVFVNLLFATQDAVAQAWPELWFDPRAPRTGDV